MFVKDDCGDYFLAAVFFAGAFLAAAALATVAAFFAGALVPVAFALTEVFFTAVAFAGAAFFAGAALAAGAFGAAAFFAGAVFFAGAALAAVFFAAAGALTAAVFFAGDIIDDCVGDRLTPAQKATAASFFRHISEAFLPTYSAILTALALTGIGAGPFVLGMLPMMILMVFIGCFFLYRGRVPFRAEGEASTHKLQDVKDFFLGLWPLIIAIVLVVGFNVNVLLSIVIVIVAYFLLDRFAPKSVLPYFKSSFQLKLFANTIAIYVFKGALTASGMIHKLPSFFDGLPIPAFLIFGLLCFLGTVIAGSQAITTTMVPVAFAAIPGSGLPLLCLLMCFIYAAMQISPTHVCLSLSCDHFGASLGQLIKLTLPIITVFLIFVCLYYLGWTALIA